MWAIKIFVDNRYANYGDFREQNIRPRWFVQWKLMCSSWLIVTRIVFVAYQLLTRRNMVLLQSVVIVNHAWNWSWVSSQLIKFKKIKKKLVDLQIKLSDYSVLNCTPWFEFHQTYSLFTFKHFFYESPWLYNFLQLNASNLLSKTIYQLI